VLRKPALPHDAYVHPHAQPGLFPAAVAMVKNFNPMFWRKKDEPDEAAGPPPGRRARVALPLPAWLPECSTPSACHSCSWAEWRAGQWRRLSETSRYVASPLCSAAAAEPGYDRQRRENMFLLFFAGGRNQQPVSDDESEVRVHAGLTLCAVPLPQACMPCLHAQHDDEQDSGAEGSGMPLVARGARGGKGGLGKSE
jgi:hypothetical protein